MFATMRSSGRHVDVFAPQLSAFETVSSDGLHSQGGRKDQALGGRRDTSRHPLNRSFSGST